MTRSDLSFILLHLWLKLLMASVRSVVSSSWWYVLMSSSARVFNTDRCCSFTTSSLSNTYVATQGRHRLAEVKTSSLSTTAKG